MSQEIEEGLEENERPKPRKRPKDCAKEETAWGQVNNNDLTTGSIEGPWSLTPGVPGGKKGCEEGSSKTTPWRRKTPNG